MPHKSAELKESLGITDNDKETLGARHPGAALGVCDTTDGALTGNGYAAGFLCLRFILLFSHCVTTFLVVAGFHAELKKSPTLSQNFFRTTHTLEQLHSAHLHSVWCA